MKDVKIVQCYSEISKADLEQWKKENDEFELKRKTAERKHKISKINNDEPVDSSELLLSSLLHEPFKFELFKISNGFKGKG